jgi:protoporphyrin/coproporphyrin ferrochelatase
MTLHFQGNSFAHDVDAPIGIVLTNLGTPDAPTARALRRYLGEFLSDPRVVEMPRWLWKIILHGIILRTRPRKAAHNYQQIWTLSGSPLLSIAQQQRDAIETYLNQHFPVKIELGMRYGTPSIPQALENLKKSGCEKILILPLYPQYASATVGSTFDAVSKTLQKWRWIPQLRFISNYHDWHLYISALVESVKENWQTNGKTQKLIFSFHGIPKQTFLAGDPYFCHCQKTARLVAEQLDLKKEEYLVTFQSRFGRQEWLQPYTDKILEQLPKNGISSVSIICPGFSADCLETLEEIDQQNRQLFLNHGGKTFHYIPALNDQKNHIYALSQLILHHLQGWENTSNSQQRQQLFSEMEKNSS